MTPVCVEKVRRERRCYEIIPLLVWSVLTRAAVIMMEPQIWTLEISHQTFPHNFIFRNKKVVSRAHELSSARDSQKFRTYRLLNEFSSSRILGAFDRNTIIFDL